MKNYSFKSGGLTLDAVVFYPQQIKTKNPTTLFVHGWTSEKERSYQYARALTKLGYICFLFDMRGHGKSEGDIKTFTIKEFLDDVVNAYDYLLNLEGVDKNNISLVGSSFGGYIIALLSEKRKVKNLVMRVPADYPNEDFNKIKATSGHQRQEIMNWRRQHKQPNETYALNALSKFDGNVLVIEAEFDDFVPSETIENYKNAVKDKSKLSYVLLKGAPHSIKEGKFRDEVERILTDWFKNRLLI